MKNKFNISESEKNRIRGLHNIKVISEQRFDPKEKHNAENKISQEDFDKIKKEAEKTLSSKFLGKYVNLFVSNSSGDEKGIIGSFKIGEINLPGVIGGEDPMDIFPYVFIAFELDDYDSNTLTDEEMDKYIHFPQPGQGMFGQEAYLASDYWTCGDKYFETTSFAPFTNQKLIRSLDEMCNEESTKQFFKLFEDKWMIVPMDVDFTMGDEDMGTSV